MLGWHSQVLDHLLEEKSEDPRSNKAGRTSELEFSLDNGNAVHTRTRFLDIVRGEGKELVAVAVVERRVEGTLVWLAWSVSDAGTA